MKNTSHQLLIILLAVGSFVTGTSEFVVSGILDIIAVDLHISIPAAGQLITVYSLFYAVGALFLVMATSKLNRKKVLLSAIFVFILGNVLAFFSHHFVLLLLSRVIMAMSGGLYIVVATNYAAQIAPPEKKGSAMATVITGFTVSLVLGVPIGTFLSGHVDWHYIFLIIALGTASLFMLLYQLLPRIEGHSHLPLKQQLHILQDRRVISGLATTVFWILGYTMVFAPCLSFEPMSFLFRFHIPNGLANRRGHFHRWYINLIIKLFHFFSFHRHSPPLPTFALITFLRDTNEF
ncbi:chemotaxis protein [Bacillus safensis FO-36b] [Bacillus safensis subsp. safensis]